MAYCFYNGVKLPELPSTAYAYCWIRKNDNTQHYDLLFTRVVGYYDGSAVGIVYGANMATTEVAHYRVAYANANTADSCEHFETSAGWYALDENRTVMWSNHYIPNGSLTATEMYFDGSEAIPEVESYRIEKDTVVGIADQVRRLCNTENTMTPAQMESNLKGLNIELMVTYVISTEEEQVIYPDEGYYGFSKITVGAVDLSSGGSGGTGGGDPGDIPSAEDITFGGEYVTTEVQTGVVSMVDKDGESFTLPKLPDVCFEDGAHWVIRKIKVSDEERKFTLICCTDEYSASDDSIAFWPSVGNKASCIFEFECSMYLGTMSETHENSTEWLPTDSFNGSLSLQAATVYLSNIIGDDGNIIGECNEVIYETEKVISFQPAEREALYTISGDTLNAIGMAVQAITNGAMMTPSAMAVALQNIGSE